MASEEGNKLATVINPVISQNIAGQTTYSNPSSWTFDTFSTTNVLKIDHIKAMVHSFLYMPLSDKQEQGKAGDDNESINMMPLPQDEQLTGASAPNLVVEELTAEQIGRLQNPPKDEVQILWIGHSTLLIQMEGKNILTDPVFSDTVGVQLLLRYRRYRKPALVASDLQTKGIKIDIVLISHNHHDHFDKDGIQELRELFPRIKWFVPMGLGKKLVESLGCSSDFVKEFTWWDSCLEDDTLMLHFTPAKHWSARGPLDWNTSLWGSWIIKSERFTVFFAGDTGYEEEIFTTIRQKYGRVDVAALPIGAYEPRDMMKSQHINPEEAVKIHGHLGARKSIGIHWRTFKLSTEGVDQPKEDLAKAMKELDVGKDDFVTLEEDLMITVDYAEKEEKAGDVLSKDRCVCGHKDSYKRYLVDEKVIGVLCEICGTEWLQKCYGDKSSMIDGNSLLVQDETFYFKDVPATEGNESESLILSEIREGDHLIHLYEEDEKTQTGFSEAIILAIDGNLLSLVTINRISPCEFKISRNDQMERSQLEKSKIVKYGNNCDPPEVVKARALAWCEGGDTAVINILPNEFPCFGRYCKCGPDYPFKVSWFVIGLFTNSLKRLVGYDSWMISRDENPGGTSSDKTLEKNKIKSGVLIKINGTRIILDLKNFGNAGNDLSKDRYDDVFCEKLFESLSHREDCAIKEIENEYTRIFEIEVSKADMRVTFSVQCIEDGKNFHVAKGTFTDNNLGADFGRFIQKNVKKTDRTVDLDELQSGDHVVLSGPPLHPRCHAIVISVNPPKRQLRLIRSTYQKGVVEEWVPAPSYLLLVARDESIDSKKVIQNARSKIDAPNQYNILTNNCKHFVQWCKKT